MSSTRLEMAKERLNLYYEAEKAILSGQAYSIGSRSLTRANLQSVQTQIRQLEVEVEELKIKETTGSVRKVYRVTPRDL